MELEITHLYLHYARDELANDYAHSQRKWKDNFEKIILFFLD